MNKYLFLLAWVSGSDSAGGDETDVHSAEDLAYQFVALQNENVFAVLIEAPSKSVALALGYAEAFHDNYTGYDTVSMIYQTSVEFFEEILASRSVKKITTDRYLTSDVAEDTQPMTSLPEFDNE